MIINNSNSIIGQLMKLSVEQILELLPNNICLGEGDKLQPMGHLTIEKYIDGTYCISYKGSNRNKKQSEQSFLFESCYCHDFKLGLIETYIKVQAITNKLFTDTKEQS